VLAAPFTTQTFRNVVEKKAPAVWAEAVRQYGPGGKGSGNFYSPANILFNYLNNKVRKKVLIKHGFVPSAAGWGISKVMLWELADIKTPPPFQEDKVFIEGGQSLRLHLVRERAPGLREHLLTFRGPNGISCDLCAETGSHFDEDIRSAIFEAHHSAAPLASTGKSETSLEDIALLCAVCHCAIHRLVNVRGRWFNIEEARQALGYSTK
jgi:hypothetical protein